MLKELKSMKRWFKFSYFKDNGINNHVFDKRSIGNCALCGSFGVLHQHHTITRSKGGGSEDLVGLCSDCHGWVHNHPGEAAKRGLYLKEYKIKGNEVS